MILENLHTVDTGMPVTIRTEQDKISMISSGRIAAGKAEQVLAFTNAIVFPGLINSHDHLDFNLFPQLGSHYYGNYIEWANDIHREYKTEINKVLAVPLFLRYEWGVFKNLLCGVTTVVNHGAPSGLSDELITIFEKSQSIHSVGFEKGWKFKLNNPFRWKQPVNIHVGEGGDWRSFNEINRLATWNLLNRELIGVHAVAMTEKQARKFKAVIWCPQTNYFMLDKTAQVNLLQDQTTVLFGTDSTLTADWDIWSHLRSARKTGMLSDETLYRTLNRNAASVWRLNTGKLEAGKDADIVVARERPGSRGYDSFFSIRPTDLLLVVHKGTIRLFDESLLPSLTANRIHEYSKIKIGGATKYVQGNLPKLMDRIRAFYFARFPVQAKEDVNPLTTL